MIHALGHGEIVGLMSGLYYLNKGCREGLWHLAADIFRKEKVHFIVLNGGIVCRRSLKAGLDEAVKQEFPNRKNHDPKEIDDFTEAYLDAIATQLAKKLPRLEHVVSQGKRQKVEAVKIYALTSPAFDGDHARRVVELLTHKRKDILLYGDNGSDQLSLKKFERRLGVYSPKKQAWMRTDYYDTPILRVLKDEMKRSASGLGDINVVGCQGSSVFHPGDSSDVQKPYLSLPVLYKIDVTQTSENQVGVRVLYCETDSFQHALVKTYSFKDLLTHERDFIQAPADFSPMEKRIVEKIKEHGALAIGQLADKLGYTRVRLQGALKRMQQSKASASWSGVRYEEESRRYFFRERWFQSHLRYTLPEIDERYISVGFGCLHAGSKNTDMQGFRDSVAGNILKYDADVLINNGDVINGLAHKLLAKDEVYGSRRFPPTYDYQEKLAAYMIGQVMMDVFKVRMQPFFAQWRTQSSITRKSIKKALYRSLIRFIAIAGNHCCWTEFNDFRPLSTFYPFLERYLTQEIESVFRRKKIPLKNLLKDLLKEKVVQLHDGESYQFTPTLRGSVSHPSMGRAKTTSIRPQAAMARSNDCQLVYLANFHTAEVVQQHTSDIGEQVCIMFPTFQVKTRFEDSKMKVTDYGGGVLIVEASKSRVQNTVAGFFGKKRLREAIQDGNCVILEEFERYLLKTDPLYRHRLDDVSH